MVRTYIETGEPVGSRTIARLRHDALSPATIRNTMANLADAGPFPSPIPPRDGCPPRRHSNCTRVHLRGAGSLLGDAERLCAELEEVHTVEERIARCSMMLTDLTSNVGIAAAMPPTGQVLDQIELVPLADRRVS